MDINTCKSTLLHLRINKHLLNIKLLKHRIKLYEEMNEMIKAYERLTLCDNKNTKMEQATKILKPRKGKII